MSFVAGSFRKESFGEEKGTMLRTGRETRIAVTVAQKFEVDKATGIALQIEGDGKAKRCTVTDELDELRELQDTDFTIMSPISYFGLWTVFLSYPFLFCLFSRLNFQVKKIKQNGKIFCLLRLPHRHRKKLPSFPLPSSRQPFTGMTCDTI